MHMCAEPPAQRRVQQMSRRVVALRRVARGAVHVRVDALAGLKRAVLGGQLHDLVLPEPDHVDHLSAAAAAGALEHA
jgi:hypothetical protein